MTEPLLVELFTEELPPKALQRLGAAFATGLLDGLRTQGLVPAEASVEAFSTPRRLAARIGSVLDSAPERAESKKLMPVKVAFGEDGKPSAALLKRLEKEGASASQLQRKIEGDSEYVFLEQTLKGVTLAAGLQTALTDTIAKLPVPKLMSYQLADGATTVQFVRPAHGLIALHGDQLVDVAALGLKAGRIAHGHRFQGVKDFVIEAAGIYEDALYTHGRVIASFDLRRVETERQLRKRAGELNASLGPEREVEALLDEVTGLIEHPTVYVGEFESAYLAVPPECLILTMRANQKYFPLFDKAGQLTNKFLIVSNMRLTDPAHIIEGNERVVRPRLADARFFFETDKKTKLEARVPQLATVTHHNKLGSQLDRVTRVRGTAKIIASLLGADVSLTDRAAYLAKADLLTLMVGEFPELQGLMGKYYARHDGEPEAVAQAIESHYWPRFAGDVLPSGPIGACVALADRLDTLVGIYGIGLVPTGEKDPFGLRRAALGVLRIIIEKRLQLDLFDLLQSAAAQFPDNLIPQSAVIELRLFILDRLKNFLREKEHEPSDIDAVVQQSTNRLDQVTARLDAVKAFRALPEAKDLAAANKRIQNILKKTHDYSSAEPDPGIMTEEAERALFRALKRIAPESSRLVLAEDFVGALSLLASIRNEVDVFFSDVLVMDDDPKTQRNRLTLLQRLGLTMNEVADISKLAS